MASTLKTEVVQNPSSATVNMTLDASGGVTMGQNLSVTGTTSLTGNATAGAFVPTGASVPTNGVYLSAANTVGIATNSTAALTISSSQNTTSAGTVVMSSPYTMRNKIINGAMVIDQRNAGASVTPNNSYTLDRWQGSNSQTGKYTVQQSSTAPTGFINSLLATSSSAYTVGATDIFALQQKIEGLNCADLAWGTANAATVTLSFWVRSSLTGTFGGSLQNNSNNRSYPFSYTISSANTWEQKTVIVTGDTTGTWLTTSGIGIIVTFSIGAGSTYSGTAGAWAGSTYYSATGATSVVGTNGATFYITGVQLERGTVATPFEYRNYQQELAMCQRYFETSYPIGTAIGTGSIGTNAAYQNINNLSGTASTGQIYVPLKITKRASPTVTIYSIGSSGASGFLYDYNAGGADKAASSQFVGGNSFVGYSTALAGSANLNFGFQWSTSAEL